MNSLNRNTCSALQVKAKLCQACLTFAFSRLSCADRRGREGRLPAFQAAGWWWSGEHQRGGAEQLQERGHLPSERLLQEAEACRPQVGKSHTRSLPSSCPTGHPAIPLTSPAGSLWLGLILAQALFWAHRHEPKGKCLFFSANISRTLLSLICPSKWNTQFSCTAPLPHNTPGSLFSGVQAVPSSSQVPRAPCERVTVLYIALALFAACCHCCCDGRKISTGLSKIWSCLVFCRWVIEDFESEIFGSGICVVWFFKALIEMLPLCLLLWPCPVSFRAS